MKRRQLLRLVPCTALLAAACTSGRSPLAGAGASDNAHRAALAALAERLPAAGTLLLGEVHDNERGHAARLAVLQDLASQRVPTVLVLEHIDRSRQGALDAARVAAPRDPQRWIDALLEAGNTRQWPWNLLRPALALAAGAQWPVHGANLTRAELAVPAARASTLGDVASRRLRAAIEDGHCGTLPEPAVARMVAMQQARDRAIVEALLTARAQAARVILLAGNGHVRRDFGVAADPQLRAAATVVSVGFVEEGDRFPDDAFDHLIAVSPQPRPDPCAALRGRTPG